MTDTFEPLASAAGSGATPKTQQQTWNYKSHLTTKSHYPTGSEQHHSLSLKSEPWRASPA